MDKNSLKYQKIPMGSSEKETWSEFKSQLSEYKTTIDNVIKLVDEKIMMRRLNNISRCLFLGME